MTLLGYACMLLLAVHRLLCPAHTDSFVCPHPCGPSLPLLCLPVQMKEQITGADAQVLRRRRLPRCIRGDRVLTPFAVAPALGLALLHNSGVGPLASLVKGAGAPLSLAAGSSDGSNGGDGVGDAYEAHVTLPMGNVAVITNYRLLMLSAPEFAVLEADVLSGRRTHVSSTAAAVSTAEAWAVRVWWHGGACANLVSVEAGAGPGRTCVATVHTVDSHD